jgi:hypothetical protein
MMTMGVANFPDDPLEKDLIARLLEEIDYPSMARRVKRANTYTDIAPYYAFIEEFARKNNNRYILSELEMAGLIY